MRLRKGSEFTTEGLKQLFTKAAFPNIKYLNLAECPAITDSVVLDIVKL